LVGHLVPAGSVHAFLAEHRREVFPDGLFVDLFPSGRGRPSVPAGVIASVLVLQTLHDFSDAEAMDAVRCDLRWKVACGLPIDHPGFHPTTLTVWRNRLRASQRPERIFEAVRAVIDRTGVLKGKTRRALDSVVLDDAVATQDTVTQLIAAVRRVRREVPGAADVIAECCHAHDWDDPGKPQIVWDDKAARDALVSALVNDANTVVAAFDGTDLDESAGRALALLALVRPGCRTRRRLGRHRRAVAHRPPGGRRPGHLHRRPAGPARAQDRLPPPGRLQGARRDRAGHRPVHRR